MVIHFQNLVYLGRKALKSEGFSSKINKKSKEVVENARELFAQTDNY